MLSRLCSITPIVTDPKPMIDLPSSWETDKIDLKRLAQLQHEQFPDYFIEASQGVDDCRYIVENGLLYTLAEPHKNAGIYPRILLPQQYRQQVIDRCHAEVAHSGSEKTLMRIQENYVWPGMRKAVRSYITACVRCNTLTPPNPCHPRGNIPTPPRPFHTWGIDLVGPFPKDRRGRQYLLTCVDHLTGWPEAIPIASKKSATVWEAFMNNVVARYGLPSEIISDNGGEFTEKGFENWLCENGVKHHYTSPYYPQSNSLTERFNGTIQKLLLKLTGGNSRKWSQFLGEALYAYRITKGRAALSPYQAVFGQLPRLPRATAGTQTEGERLQALRLAMDTLHEFRQETRAAYQAKESCRSKRLQPGTFVSLRVLQPKKGQPKWQPGYKVLSSHDGGLRVLQIDSNRILRVNQKNVREIPEFRPYEEIDPLVQSRAKVKDIPPEEAGPIPVAERTPFHSLVTAEIQPTPMTEWVAWCDFVQSHT